MTYINIIFQYICLLKNLSQKYATKLALVKQLSAVVFWLNRADFSDPILFSILWDGSKVYANKIGI